MPNQTPPTLTDEERDAALGPDEEGLGRALRAVFQVVQGTYEKTNGDFAEHLFCLTFEDGRPIRCNGMPVSRSEHARARAIIEDMLTCYPVVVHATEAWGAPPDSKVAPSQHPERFDVVNLALITTRGATNVPCRMNKEDRTLLPPQSFRSCTRASDLRRTAIPKDRGPVIDRPIGSGTEGRERRATSVTSRGVQDGAIAENLKMNSGSVTLPFKVRLDSSMQPGSAL